ncbi:MAG: class I SAM-dependent methyltransferase [Limibacillus sp.]
MSGQDSSSRAKEALAQARECLSAQQPAKALAVLRRALAAEPSEKRLWRLFVRALSLQPRVEVTRGLPGELAHCLADPELATPEIRNLANNLFMGQALIQKLMADFDGLTLRGLFERAKDKDPEQARLFANLKHPLVLNLLTGERIPYRETELLLAAFRRAFLEQALKGEGLDAALWPGAEDFLAALACQCFINEYIYFETEVEKAGAERLLAGAGADAGAARLALLGCYRPLADLPFADDLPIADEGAESAAGLAALKQSAPGRSLLRLQLEEPRREAALRGTIESVTPVEDATSQAVRAQYEANPYPRWMALPPLPETALGGGARGFLKRALPLAGPAVLPELPEHPSVLIAGCGTGRQALDIARRLPEAKITALDLSVSSLAYAKRKAEGAGVENVSFVQGDLLALTETGGAGFDMIFCSGVLHHLAEPEAGLAAITSRLKPGGVMKLALYSREARAFLKPAREKLAALGLCADAEGIRQARFALFNLPEGDPARAVTAWLDFYSLSDCRDALFHVQERDYHALELAEYLATQDLTFLGFQGLPRETAQAYRARFPQDPEARDLTNWAAFEPDHPLTFVAMYQFWVSR